MPVNPIDHSSTCNGYIRDEDRESSDRREIGIDMQCSVLRTIVNNTREESGKSSSPIPVFYSSPSPIFSTNPYFSLNERMAVQNHPGTYRATNYIKMAERRRVRVTRFRCPLTNFDDSCYETRSPKEVTAATS